MILFALECALYNIRYDLISLHIFCWQVKDICGHYERRYILKDINLALKPGTTYLVMGPPGELFHADAATAHVVYNH